VATSLVYLIRSLGTIYGVTITSAIVQNVLVLRLPKALWSIDNRDQVGLIKTRIVMVPISNGRQVIEEIRRSVFALRSLPAEVQVPARIVYYEAIRIAFLASAAFSACAVLASLVANGQGLQRKSCKTVGSDDETEC